MLVIEFNDDVLSLILFTAPLEFYWRTTIKFIVLWLLLQGIWILGMYMIVYKKKRDVHVMIQNLIVSTGIYTRLRVELMLKQLIIYLSVRSSLFLFIFLSKQINHLPVERWIIFKRTFPYCPVHFCYSWTFFTYICCWYVMLSTCYFIFSLKWFLGQIDFKCKQVWFSNSSCFRVDIITSKQV